MQIMDFRQFFSNDPWFLRHLFSVRRASFSSLRLSSSLKETKNMNKVASAMKKFANVALIIDVRGRSTFPWNSFRLDGKKVMISSFNGLLLAMLNLQHIIGKKIVARPMMGFIAFLSVSPPPECEANSPCLLLHIFTQKSPRNCWTPHTQQRKRNTERAFKILTTFIWDSMDSNFSCSSFFSSLPCFSARAAAPCTDPVLNFLF